MDKSSLQGQIKAQGEVVRQLKKDKAPEEKVYGLWIYISVYFRTRTHTRVLSRDGSFKKTSQSC